MNGVHRFLSRRDKKGGKAHPGHSKDLFRIFHLEEKKRFSRDDDKSIQDILRRLEEIEIHNVKESHIKYALHHPYSKGDPDKALELLRLFQDTLNGKVVKFNPNIPMLGAENRNMVTCYIDSLFFAMFARLDSFESVLSVEFEDPATNTLATLLRFWVNMLRTGKLITVDIVKHIQEALADCGWEDAKLIRQQDVSEAFTFITDKLALPLLTLKMDVYHTGKASMDDHRYVRERLLDVAIPESPPADGTDVKLEDCLENFFNNKIEVKRLLQRRNTVTARPGNIPEKGSQTIEKVEYVAPVSTQDSVFRRRKMELLSGPKKPVTVYRDDTDVSYGKKEKDAEAASVRKEVLIPAWQFFHLIPWFQAKSPVEGQRLTTDAQVAAHFAKRRPVLGICLKRYQITKDGPKRLDTYIDIPLEIRLPHFISDGTEDDGFGSSFSTFKLSLQSVICHRGNSLNAGHYVSIVRPTPHEIRTLVDSAERRDQWLMFDDLAKDRVTQVDVRKALKAECPYLLFYQVQLVNDDYDDEERSRSSSEQDEPPPYTEVVHTSTNSSDPSTDNTAQTSQVAITTPETSLSEASSIVIVDNDDSQTPQANTPQPISTTSAITVDSDALSPPQLSLGQVHSAPSKVQEATQRPRSLDLPGSPGIHVLKVPEGRASHDSGDKRSSVAFTENSFLPSAQVTPSEYLASEENIDYIEAKDLSLKQTPSGSLKPPNEANSRPQRDSSRERTEKRHSRTSWLNVGSKKARPKSMPPNENRTTMGEFMKGLKGAMSKDKLNIGLANDGDSPNLSASGSLRRDSRVLDSVVMEEDPKVTKDKGKAAPFRRKSLRARSKARMSMTLAKDDEGEDRQCSLM